MRSGRRLLTAGLLVVGLGAAGLWAAATASAHVTVDAPGATRGGGDQIINFRVPTESDTASTVELNVALPTDTPIASVLVQPVTGWSFTETTVKLAKPIVTDDGDITEAVSQIDWKADDSAAAIKPQQFQQFTIIAGQLPDTPSLTFKAIQTYSDNSVVSWTEVEAPGSNADLDHPAPVLELPVAAPGSTGNSSSSTGPTILSIIALVIAVAAAGYAFVTRGRHKTPPADLATASVTPTESAS